jgi:hypothetical protein
MPLQIKSPKITSLTLPANALVSSLLTLFFAFLYLSPVHFPSESALAATLTNSLRSLLGPFIISFTFWTLLILHCLESLYTLYLCLTHSAGIVLGVSFVSSILYELHERCSVCR